jgi:hypothetical protein
MTTPEGSITSLQLYAVCICTARSHRTVLFRRLGLLPCGSGASVSGKFMRRGNADILASLERGRTGLRISIPSFLSAQAHMHTRVHDAHYTRPHTYIQHMCIYIHYTGTHTHMPSIHTYGTHSYIHTSTNTQCLCRSHVNIHMRMP